MIRKALEADLKAIEQLAIKTRKHMQDNGLKQWPGDYPNLENFEADLKKQGLYVYEDNNIIKASITILPENDPPYKEIRWYSDHALVIHRLVVDPDYQLQGIGQKMFEKAIELTKESYQSLKVDTHPDNTKMQKLILKMKFQYMGYLASINRLAYEWNLKDKEKEV